MKDGDPMPVDVDRVTPGSYVGDVILKADVTPFLRAALEKGCTVQVGSDMLFELIRFSRVLRLRQCHSRRTAHNRATALIDGPRDEVAGELLRFRVI
jgi:shikimate 5-dehydrogenase